MAKSVNQEEYRRTLLDDAARNAGRLRELGEGLDDATLRRRPAGGGWSIAEVYEHLCIADDSYLVPLRALLSRPDLPRIGPAGAEWKPSFVGALLVRGQSSSLKLPAPRIYRPGPTPRPDVVAEYLRRQEELARLLEGSGSIHWRRVRMRSPVSALVRLNLGDCFTVLVVHAARHILQIERVRRAA